MTPEPTKHESFLSECESVIMDLYAECLMNAPNFGVGEDCFRASLRRSITKYLIGTDEDLPSFEEAETFLRSIQANDLFMALGCANGSERAWWEFDQQHRTYLERISRHLASSDLNAQEVVDLVYVELYGTRVVDGERVSKFATYSGKGSIRGWLRTVIWHSLIDLHRASHDEVSLDEMTENVGEGHAHSTFAENDLGGEDEMIDHLARERYRKATVSAIETAFSTLDDHEKLLLLYYHVDNLKLREIARLVEVPSSPLRNWFQRRSAAREENPKSKIHESTIMRWLEKTYTKVLETFCEELKASHQLKEEEIDICMELATQDLANPDIYKNLATSAK
ncbi:MAG: hypothetical protein KDB79_00155 [Acidobacteria bacterium]|nr:hypothetical protein [Acidobacteriota bacterium]